MDCMNKAETDQAKTKTELIAELDALHERVAVLEGQVVSSRALSETRKRAETMLQRLIETTQDGSDYH